MRQRNEERMPSRVDSMTVGINGKTNHGRIMLLGCIIERSNTSRLTALVPSCLVVSMKRRKGERMPSKGNSMTVGTSGKTNRGRIMLLGRKIGTHYNRKDNRKFNDSRNQWKDELWKNFVTT